MSEDREVISIDCSGPMALSAIEAMRDRFRDAMNSGERIEVDCKDTSDVSICFIQLLLAARASATRRDIGFRVIQPVSAALHDALERGGFVGKAGSVRESGEFWTGGP